MKRVCVPQPALQLFRRTQEALTRQIQFSEETNPGKRTNERKKRAGSFPLSLYCVSSRNFTQLRKTFLSLVVVVIVGMYLSYPIYVVLARKISWLVGLNL